MPDKNFNIYLETSSPLEATHWIVLNWSRNTKNAKLPLTLELWRRALTSTVLFNYVSLISSTRTHFLSVLS